MANKPFSKRIFASFWFQAIAVVLVIAAALELVARAPFTQRFFVYKSVGNFDYQFEIKWFKLEDFVKKNGGVDVILLGSSLVNTGIDPDVMAETYYQETGLRLRIFNFGVEGLTVAPNSVNAQILVNKYHPALLLYVTEMRDYIATTGLDYEKPFLSSPWIQYQAGRFNLPGWLIAHSTALQDFLPYRNWMRADFPQSIYSLIYRSQRTSAGGYEAELAHDANIDLPPDPNNPVDAQYFADYGNYKTAPSRLADLQTILDLGQITGTKILVVEMPVHPTFYVYVGGEAIHQQFQQEIASLVKSKNSSFIPAETCSDIPLIGRANRWHLNNIGAPVFSRCLGLQLAELRQQTGTDFIKLQGNATP